jgi:hypothetical protein
MKDFIISYFEGYTEVVTFQTILFSFLMSLILAFAIYISYRFSHSSVVYSAKFNATLVMLAVVTTLIMSVISNNIALSLGMVGALSIVRFRTAVKDARDTTYIFWSIAVGICCGVYQYLVAFIGSAVIFLMMLGLGLFKSNDRFLLIIHAAKKAQVDIEKKVLLFYEGKAIPKVKNSTVETVEYIFQLSTKLIYASQENDQTINEVLFEIDGVEVVNVVSQNEEISQ